MAETGNKGASKAMAASETTEPTEPTNTTKESSNAGYLVSTLFPNASFDAGEGIPIVTSEGTKLTKAQLTKVESLAPEYDIRLSVEEVN